MYDLNTLASQETADLRIRDPRTNKPTGAVLTLAGPGHPVVEALRREPREQPGDGEQDADDMRINRAIARRILGWTPLTVDKQPFPYSTENALALMTAPRWTVIRGQVIAYLSGEAAFLPAAAPG